MRPFYWLGIFMAMIPQFFFAVADHQHGGNLVVAGAPVRIESIEKKCGQTDFWFCFNCYIRHGKIKLAVSLEIKRNATGHIVDLSGVSALMLDWLTRRYKLKFVYCSKFVIF